MATSKSGGTRRRKTASAKPTKTSPGKTMEASGAIIEPQIPSSIPTDHPAVDSHPREGVPAKSNEIDFNDPTKSQSEAVEDNLKA